MTPNEAAEILAKHNEWRKTAEGGYPSSGKVTVTQAIDVVIAYIQKHEPPTYGEVAAEVLAAVAQVQQFNKPMKFDFGGTEMWIQTADTFGEVMKRYHNLNNQSF